MIVIRGRSPRSLAWRVLPFVAATLLLSWVAIADGYPLVFADTGTYIAAGLELRYPPDRPPVYGLAIAPLILAAGLWAVVIAQGLVAAILIHLVLETTAAATPRTAAIRLVVTTALVALFGSLPWFTGQVMPDFATGLVCLALYVTVARPERAVAWATALLLSLLIGVHLSHILLAALLIGLAALALLVLEGWREALRRCLPGACALFAAVVALSGMNLVGGGRFTPSLSSDMFTLARLFDGRLAQPLLAARCRGEAMMLCAVRPMVDDPTDPKPGQAFLWSSRTPLWRLAAEYPDAIRREERTIIADTVRTRPAEVAALAWRGWREQLLMARTGQLVAYGEGQSVTQRIAAHLPGEMPAFRAALQQQGRLEELKRVPDDAIAFALLLAAPFILAWAWITRRRRLAGLAAAIVVTVLANAAIAGALSGPDDRYQARVTWLPLLLAICALWSYARPATRPAD